MQKTNHHSTVGVIGLGIMGSAIACNLQSSGFSVLGVELMASTRRKLAKQLTEVHSVPSALIGKTQLIITSLPSSNALMQVCHELVEACHAAGIVNAKVVLAEVSTFPVKDKQEASKLLASVGIAMIDAPLSGTGAQAKNKDLTVYASGETSSIKKMMPVFQGFSREQFNVGEFGNGMKMKLVANLLVAIHNVSAAEAILFGKKLGLQPKRIVEVVSGGAGGSRMFQVRGPMMAARSWSQATMKNQVWQKDMSIIYEALQELSLPAPLFAACIPIYQAAMSQGHQLHDTAAVYAVLEKFAGESS